MTGRRKVVQQPVRAEVMAEINFRQQIAIQVRGADGQGPTVFDRLVKNAGDLAELGFRLLACHRGRPKKDVFPAPIQRLGLAFVHHFNATGVRIQDMAAVLKIIADDQVHVAIAVEVCLDCAIGEPAFAAIA